MRRRLLSLRRRRTPEPDAPARSRRLTPAHLHNPWPRRAAVAAAGLALLGIAGGAAYALTRDDDDADSAATIAEETFTTEGSGPVYYLQALAAKVRPSGCTAVIRFTWKPHYNADRHYGEMALVRVTGPGIEGDYRVPFTRAGAVLEPPPVSLAGGYVLWTAKVVSVGGDPPDNETLVRAGNPASNRC